MAHSVSNETEKAAEKLFQKLRGAQSTVYESMQIVSIGRWGYF